MRIKKCNKNKLTHQNITFLMLVIINFCLVINVLSQVKEEWVARYNSAGNDYSRTIAIDNSGNVYVTGRSSGPGTGSDYVTIKYNSLGGEQWVARYNGPGNNSDYACAIEVDSSGNVYVTGTSAALETYPYNYDYATIKYNNSGVEQWVTRYNAPGNGRDVAKAIAVDSSGNVYVTGESYGLGTYDDYATVKYNSSGVEQWVARYTGGGDYATAIALDDSGNVYVTGYSGSNYATIKYNSAGIQQWVARYDGPGHSDDRANAISIDGSGNVYVTGESEGSGTYYDYATIKYNNAGVQQWVARYNGPGNDYDGANAIAIDSSGNVYVTGTSTDAEHRYNYLTIKYNSSGVEEWVARYKGLTNFGDYATAIALDSSGNIYVTGWSGGSGITYDYVTIKYNNSGVAQYVMRYNGPGNSDDRANAIALDSSGNVYVTGWSTGSGTGYDYATIKYNSAGVQLWGVRYSGTGNSEDIANTIALDNCGNIYVTGYSYGLAGDQDSVTIKYNVLGVKEWVARYDGLSNSYDEAEAIVVDNLGNVYVTGRSKGLGTYSDYLTIKYNSSGIEQWVARYDGPINDFDSAHAIAIDSLGNVYVTGYSEGLGTRSDYLTIKYNSSGVEQWLARYNGPSNTHDIARRIAIDNWGNVYVTGSSESSDFPSNYDYATIKYNNMGIEQWVARYDGPGGMDDTDWALAIALDNSGNVYVTGYSYGSGSTYDYLTIKYNNMGIEQWIARYDGPVNAPDRAKAIAVDIGGNVYVTGYSYGIGTNEDYATIKYNEAGVEQWVARYNGPGNGGDGANAIAIDSSRNIYVTGYSLGSGTSMDYTTIKYNNWGVEQWVKRYNGPGDGDDRANAIAIDNSVNVYVVGYSVGSGTGADFTTIKYSQSTFSESFYLY